MKEIAPPLSEEVRDVKVQEMNLAEEEITLPESMSGPSQDVIVLLLLMQFLYVGSTFEMGLFKAFFLTHSVNEELEDVKES